MGKPMSFLCLSIALTLGIGENNLFADAIVPVSQSSTAGIRGFSHEFAHEPRQFGVLLEHHDLMAPVAYDLANTATSGGVSATAGVDVAITSLLESGHRMQVSGAVRVTGAQMCTAPGVATSEAWQTYSLVFELHEPKDSRIDLHVASLFQGIGGIVSTDGYVRLHTPAGLIWQREWSLTTVGDHSGFGVLPAGIYTLDVNTHFEYSSYFPQVETQLTAFDFDFEVGPVPGPSGPLVLAIGALLAARRRR